ncbi:MAG: flavin reductase family protein [Gammaproteobacteria bacterium]|nr:flavin reductase family protein [Gammaproteobacteria bacterium]
MASSHSAPPAELETPLELNPSDWDAQQTYYLLTGLVIPRPIAWVSTVATDGTLNLAPHSYFNAIASAPPHVMFSSTGVKDTLRNVTATKEFVVNIVGMDQVEKMNFTATDFPAEEDEFAWAHLEQAASSSVRPPRVKAAKAHLECQLVEVVPVGNSNLVIGEVVHFHVDPSVWRAGRVDAGLLNPVCRLSGSGYAGLGDLFKLPRPKWADVSGSSGLERMPRRG